MKILVIGGSYFYGRVFVMLAAGEHDVTVVNRGTYSVESLGARQIRGDRRDRSVWKGIKEKYDVIVDFCAYEKDDIATVLQNMDQSPKQYVLISTVDVYRRGIKGRKNEDTPLETRVFSGEAGEYIAGKVALEREVREECAGRGIEYTVLRPAVLYGPYNYAPRESMYIQMMVKNGLLPHINDAQGRFQMVYVKDAAEAAVKALLNENAYGRAYNLCEEEEITYDRLYEALRNAAGTEAEGAGSGEGKRGEAAGGTEAEGAGSGAEKRGGAAGGTEIKELRVTVEEAREKGIPLPFAVTEEETELYDNGRSKRELGLSYTGLLEGMGRTYRAFRAVYGG